MLQRFRLRRRFRRPPGPVQGSHRPDHQVQPGDHGPVPHQLAEYDVPPSAAGGEPFTGRWGDFYLH